MSIDEPCLTNFDKVEEFHEKFDLEMPEGATMPDQALFFLRYSLIKEELLEFGAAYAEQNLVEMADALGDILYTTYGAGVCFGFDMDKIFAEIHRSNMTKLSENGKALKGASGKVRKGPFYRPPVLAPILGVSR